jgi:uncharacterized protein (TIGR03086 family)
MRGYVVGDSSTQGRRSAQAVYPSVFIPLLVGEPLRCCHRNNTDLGTRMGSEQYVLHATQPTYDQQSSNVKLSDFQQTCIELSGRCITAARHHVDSRIGEWSVDDLASHLVMVNVMCINSLGGRGPEMLPVAESVIAGDVDGAFRRTSDDFARAFAGAADVTMPCPTPVGLHPAWVVQTQGSLEHLVHGLDLVRALELGIEVDDSVIADAATRVLASGSLYDTFRSMGMYAPPASCAPNATATDRLLAYLGRASNVL